MKTTIKARITQGLAFLLLVILLLSGIGGYYLYQVARSPQAAFHDNYRSVAYAQQLTAALADLREARLAAGPAESPAAQRARQVFERNLAAEQRNITEPGEGRLADSLAAGFRQYLALSPAEGAAQAVYQRLRSQAGRVATLNLRGIEERSRSAQRVATRTITVLALLAVSGVLTIFSFVFSFPDYVTKPIEELTGGIRRLAAGDYSQRLPALTHPEFAEVTTAFNEMARKLESYETAEGTLRIDSSGALDVVTAHRRPGTVPQAPAALGERQRQLLQQVQEQAQQLRHTTDALLRTGTPPAG